MDDLTQQTVWIHFHFSNQNLTFSIRTTTRSQRLLANRPSRQLSHKCLKSKVLQKNKANMMLQTNRFLTLLCVSRAASS